MSETRLGRQQARRPDEMPKRHPYRWGCMGAGVMHFHCKRCDTNVHSRVNYCPPCWDFFGTRERQPDEDQVERV